MNTIHGRSHKTRYAAEPHLMVIIDGIPLDEFLAARSGDEGLIGLVPTLLDWLEDPAERSLTWQQIDPPARSAAVAPLLMCPDDLDLWCTVVVVEVEATEDRIYWHRFGYAIGRADPAQMPAAVLATVEWFAALESLSFAAAEYRACLDQFRSALSDAAPPAAG